MHFWLLHQMIVRSNQSIGFIWYILALLAITTQFFSQLFIEKLLIPPTIPNYPYDHLSMLDCQHYITTMGLSLVYSCLFWHLFPLSDKNWHKFLLYYCLIFPSNPLVSTRVILLLNIYFKSAGVNPGTLSNFKINPAGVNPGFSKFIPPVSTRDSTHWNPPVSTREPIPKFIIFPPVSTREPVFLNSKFYPAGVNPGSLPLVSTREPMFWSIFPPLLWVAPEKAKNFNIVILWFCEDNYNNAPVLDIYVDINVCDFIQWSHV